MQRSDNFPICATLEMMCQDVSGKFFIYTGFPVKSAMVSPVNVPVGSELMVDSSFGQDDGFYVIYNGVPVNSIIKFSYIAQ